MFYIASLQLAKMFVLILVGYTAYRTKLISHEGTKTLSNLFLYIINPVVIFVSFQTDFSSQLLIQVLTAIFLSISAHVAAIVLAHVLLPDRNASFEVQRFSSVYSNCGFMGIPLIMSLFGTSGILFISTYMIAFNLLAWTHGLILMTGDTSAKQLVRGICTPAIISVFLGLIFFAGRIRLPGLILDTADYITSMNTAVGMLIAGSALAEVDLSGALKKSGVYIVCAIKLLIVPLALIVPFHFLHIDRMILITIIVAAACPTAATSTMFAVRFNKDYHYASEIFAISTVLSILTIPVVILICERFI